MGLKEVSKAFSETRSPVYPDRPTYHVAPTLNGRDGAGTPVAGGGGAIQVI